ncbi:enhancer of polycomb homolog 2 isoform X2 [Pungitius pungitius]|uniref:enhancer of polycomb homolog 2 isoform X2 n=1 Tax=Pungitius pungitius TaxID=134920 RepID=UPI002E10BBBA
MSKLSFRARALDAAKPLPVYRNRDLPDLTDCVSINRAVPQMPSGMEKEEELEHHLQRAMSAQQVFREKKENMVIPVPETESNTTYYDRLYKGEVKVPKQLIHIQPLGLDRPDYDMDSEDETLLNRLNRKMEIKPLQFETMVDRLEKSMTLQLVPLSEAKLLLNEDDYLLKSVYDYWLRKRKNFRGPSLTPHIKQEKRDGSTNSDAYVAFRRRTEKMQTRKNRKNDEASYEKMLRLRREFSRAVTTLEMIKRREKSKRELLHLTLEVVEKRYQMEDFSGEALREVSLPLVEKPVYSAPFTLNNRHRGDIKIKLQRGLLHSTQKNLVFDEHASNLLQPKNNIKRERLCPPQRRPCPFTVNKANIRQYDFHSSGEEDSSPPPLSPPSPPDGENDPDGVYVFRRKAGCQYLAPGADQPGGDDHSGLHHSLAKLILAPHWTGLGRRRIGRGGRVILDRAFTGLDPLLKELESLTHRVCRTRTSNDTVTLEQNPPQTSGTTAPFLTEVLRRFCFRPRPAQGQRKGGSRTTALCMKDLRGLCNNSGGTTEEEYHSHQQQLIQMQRKQLEQLQLQNHSAPYRLYNTQSSRSSETRSATVNSASAQFAASAVISAPLPPYCHMDRQKKPYKCNGGLYSSGASKLAYLSSSPQSLPNKRNQAGAVFPSPAHTARPFAPPTSAIMVAASLDRVPKVSAARNPHESERPLNGLSETTLPMEVT